MVLVDDDSQVRELYAGFLEGEYEIATGDSGEVALEPVDDSVDVVPIDRRMGGLPGGDVVMRLREAGHDMPVTMVTAVEFSFSHPHRRIGSSAVRLELSPYRPRHVGCLLPTSNSRVRRRDHDLPRAADGHVEVVHGEHHFSVLPGRPTGRLEETC